MAVHATYSNPDPKPRPDPSPNPNPNPTPTPNQNPNPNQVHATYSLDRHDGLAKTQVSEQVSN